MQPINTDVDIDVFRRDDILSGLDCVFGGIDRANKFEKHPTGVYFQNIPRDPVSNVATMDHRIANTYGYFKIDFLNVNLYEDVQSEEHLLSLINKEPPWDFLLYEDITDNLFQLNGHSKLLQKFKPQSIEDLAIILAIIRPAKAHLQSENWDTIKKAVWLKDDNEGYVFKRCHSISYAIAIVVDLNLLIEQLAAEDC